MVGGQGGVISVLLFRPMSVMDRIPEHTSEHTRVLVKEDTLLKYVFPVYMFGGRFGQFDITP